MKMQKNIVTLIVVVVVGGGVGFLSGMKYESGKSVTAVSSDRTLRFGSGQNAQGTGGGMRTRLGGGATFGEVVSKDETSITVKMRDGGSRIVFYTPTTPLTKMMAGTISELVVGANVVVGGTPNPDGSVTAQSIQLAAQGLQGAHSAN